MTFKTAKTKRTSQKYRTEMLTGKSQKQAGGLSLTKRTGKSRKRK